MNYPIRFINTNIPTNHCNMRCSYCYIGQTFGYDNKGMYEGNLQFSFDHMKRCLTIERLGGVCFFNLCSSGETLLYPKLPEIIEMLLDLGHWVSIVTNLTIDKPLNRIVDLPAERLQHMFFKCSYHHLELKRLNLLDKFFNNVGILKQKGIAFTIELTVNDETIPFIDEIKTICIERLGALPHVIESRNQGEEHFFRLTKLPVEEHQKIWGSFDSPLFNYQQKNWDKQITNFCYAGDWRISFDMYSGNVSQCDIPDCPNNAKALPNMFDLSNKYQYTACGKNCPLPHCFITYVHSSLINCWGEDTIPTYAEERDRVCADGSTWLTPLMREVFSHRMSEWHDSYSDDKKLYIDCIMRWQYKRECPSEDESVRLAGILRRRFAGSSVGLVLAPEWLESILKSAGVELKFVVEVDGDTPSPGMKQRLKARFRYLYRKLCGDKTVKMTLFDVFPKCEIIICDYVKFLRLSKTIEQRNGALKIVNIVEVIE